MSLKMTREEREAFLAGVHVGIISIAEAGRGPLAVPIWYGYAPGGDLWIVIEDLADRCQLSSMLVFNEWGRQRKLVLVSLPHHCYPPAGVGLCSGPHRAAENICQPVWAVNPLWQGLQGFPDGN